MSKVGSKQFGDGWQSQGKSVSQKLADSRKSTATREARQASRILDQGRTSQANRPNSSQQTEQARQSQLTHADRPAPQSLERHRPETHERAARQGNLQSNEFIKNREDAQNLRRLQTKAPTVRSAERAVTKQAVVDKGTSTRPDLGRQNVGKNVTKLMQQAGDAAQRQVAREKAARHLPSAHGYTKPDKGRKAPKAATPHAYVNPQKDVERAAAMPKGVEPQAAKKADESKRSDRKGEEKKSDSGTKTNKGAGRAAYTGDSSATRDLNSMLGGYGGGAESNGHDAPDSAALATVLPSDLEKRDTIPEQDPTFHVYSEFDTANPGVEMVKSKAQLFSRHIEKRDRLQEIAKLDEELGGKIEDLFKDKGFKERIVGDLKHEIKLADMLGSPYGNRMFRG